MCLHCEEYECVFDVFTPEHTIVNRYVVYLCVEIREKNRVPNSVLSVQTNGEIMTSTRSGHCS